MFALSILVTGMGLAQQPAVTPASILMPFGAWTLCEGPYASSPLCVGFVPGSEEYLLLLRRGSDATQAFGYSIDALMVDGSARHFEGMVARRDNQGGVTVQAVLFGGVAASWRLTVTEYAAVAVQQQSGS